MLKKFFRKRDKRTKLEMEIDDVLEYMHVLSPTNEKYKEVSENLERLHKMKMAEKPVKSRVSPDVIVTVTGSIFTVGAILWHEKADVITTKALGFVLKGRL